MYINCVVVHMRTNNSNFVYKVVNYSLALKGVSSMPSSRE